MLRRYVFGPGGEPLVWYEGTWTSDRHWLHGDERGSVIALSNDAGNLTDINRYDDYGVAQGALAGRFGYTGQAWLPQAGVYDYQNRVYNPALGRFMQTDPIRLGGGMNLYAYVGNDPVNFVDPLGLGDACGDDLHVAEITVCGHRPPTGVGGINSFGGNGNALVTEANAILERIFARHEEEEQTVVVTGTRTPPIVPASMQIGGVCCFGGGGASASYEDNPLIVVTAHRRLGIGLAMAAFAYAQNQPNDIYFGYPPDANARHHIDTHLSRLTEHQRRLLKQAIARQIRARFPYLAPGQGSIGIVVFMSREYEYHAYGVSLGITNVGTVFDVTE